LNYFWNIKIYINVPTKVTVGYIFQVAVRAKKSSTSTVKKALIKASINSASEITQTLSTSKIEDMIMQLGSGS